MSGRKQFTRLPANIDDPNQGRNRVPSQSELVTLRNLQAQKRELSETLEKQLSAARAAHEQILARHKALLDELECVKSEVIASHNFVTLLEQQQASLVKDNKQLLGLIHAVRRCPDEILRSIFECAIEDEPSIDEQLRIATRLSSVCQTWRAVALQTRKLWAQLSLDVNEDINGSALSLQRARKRAGQTPMDIAMRLTQNTGNDVTSFIRALNLKRHQSILSLTITFQSSGEEGLIEIPALRYDGPLDTLTIKSWHPIENVTDDPVPWDFSCIVRKFPQTTHLILHRFVNVTGHEGTSTSLRTLELCSVENFDFAILAQLKNLERLVLSNVQSWEEDLPDEIVLPNLRELKKNSAFPWHVIQAPQLHKLVNEHSEDEEDYMAFICRHTSILHLEMWMYEEEFRQIALALVGLETLSIKGCMKPLFEWEKLGLKSPPFPKLTTLRIEPPEGEELGLKDFENLVKGRCPGVRSAARAYKGLAQLKTLEILDFDECVQRAAWAKDGALEGYSQCLSRTTDYEGMTTVTYTRLR